MGKNRALQKSRSERKTGESMKAFLILEDGTVFTGTSIGSKKEIISETMVLMESYFDPKFQALSEQINPVPKEAIDILEGRVDDLEKAVELHTQQINELKKAQ